MFIQSIPITGVSASTCVASQSDQVLNSQVDVDEITPTQRPSVHEASVRELLPRLNSINIRLNDVSVAASCLSMALLPDSADFDIEACRGLNYLKSPFGECIKVQSNILALIEKIEASKVSEHLLELELSSACRVAGSREMLDIERSLLEDTLGQLRGIPYPPRDVQDTLNQPKASDDFFVGLQGTIDIIKNQYLSIYENVLTVYSNFYKDFNEKIMAKMGDWITGKEDGKKVEISADLFNSLDKLIKYYEPGGLGNAQLYPVNSVATSELAQQWSQALGVPLQGSFGTVRIDLSPLRSMADSLKGKDKITMDAAQFQAWQTGFSSQESALKNQLQLFTTKYANANSYYENFNKILSSQLSQYAEMLKAIASGIG